MLPHRKHSALAINALSLYLREPCQQVRTLLSRHARLQKQLDYKRHHLLSISQLQRLRKSFGFPGQAAYASLLARDSRARILATFHMGDYVFGMNALIASTPHAGLVRVLSQRAASTQHWQNVRKSFGTLTPGPKVELLTANTSQLQLSAILRERGNTLLLFCDLPAGNGELIKVKFLGRDAWFPRGAATLAVMNRVPLLPVITFRINQRNQIVMLPQLESRPNLARGEQSLQCIQRLTQEITNILEAVFIAFPDQWRFLPCLPLYFSAPETAAAPVSALVSPFVLKPAARTQRKIYKECSNDIRGTTAEPLPSGYQ